MEDKKDKKKTLTISSTLTRKIDTSFLGKDRKKTFSIEKKKPFKGTKSTNRPNQNLSSQNRTDNNKKNGICYELKTQLNIYFLIHYFFSRVCVYTSQD